VPEVLDQFVDMVRLPRRALPAMVRALEKRVHGTMASFEVAAFADDVRLPVLVAHDTDDKEVSYEHGIRLAELLGARLLTTSGLGHRRILFAPEVVSAIVEFIEQGRVLPTQVPSAMEKA
jgi:pimeloyl-ACP methyl ester carboxylesterase